MPVRIKRIFWMMAALPALAACVCPPAQHYTGHVIPTDTEDGAVRVVWMGTAGLYITDGETGIYIDPFVSRYGLRKVGLGFRLNPDHELIEKWIKISGGHHASAVLTSHSHYDHAMDAPYFAARTGALIAGSLSTANVARGAGLPEKQIRVIADGEQMVIGKFTATFIKSIHSPVFFGRIPWPGEITEPLRPPAPASAYREGGTYAIVLSHPRGTLLHYGSAGIKPGIFENISAEAVFLSLGGRQDTPSLLTHVVAPVRAERVIPIHYDNFFAPLDAGDSCLIGVDMNEFQRSAADFPGISVTFPPLGRELVLFP
jgi:L-ascorbate metabolism protein UlaG (beta-lactamase superfamily)